MYDGDDDDYDNNDNDDDNYDYADDNGATADYDYCCDDNDDSFIILIIYSLDKFAIKTFQLQHPLLYLGYMLT